MFGRGPISSVPICGSSTVGEAVRLRSRDSSGPFIATTDMSRVGVVGAQDRSRPWIESTDHSEGEP